MKLLATFCVVAFVLCQTHYAEASNKRCRYSFLRFLNSCKISCKILGHETGVCDEEDRCICSETEYNFLQDVGEWFEENLDLGSVVDRMENRFLQYRDEIKSWRLSESLKTLVPSKCKIGQEFCSKACRSVGKVRGKCNEDFTDCDCSDEWVTAKQYGLCASETICGLDCQANGFATGACKGSDGWDCRCESMTTVATDANNGKEVDESAVSGF